MKILYTPEDISKKLSKLEKQLCCVSGNIVYTSSIDELSLLNTSKYTTAIVDNVGVYKFTTDTLVANGYSIVTAIGGFWQLTNSAQYERVTPDEYMVMADVLPGGIADGMENVTKTGVVSTATFSKVGNYDKVAVTGGVSYTNFLVFNNQRIQDNGMNLKLRIKVDTVGATLPLIGIGLYGIASSHDTNSSGIAGMYVINLLTKVMENRSYNCNGTGIVPKSSAGTLCSNGDILEIRMNMDLNSNSGKKTFSLINETTGAYAYYEATSLIPCVGYKLSMRLALALTDGAYTILEYKGYSSIPQNSLLCIMGDSYGCGGPNTGLYNSVTANLKSYLPEYDIGCIATGATYVVTMANTQIRDILKLKPKYVLLLQILNVYWAYFDDGGANQTEYDDNMTAILDSITGYGGIPILVKWQTTGGFINNHSDEWDIKRAAHLAAYPTALELDLSNEALVLSDNSHPNSSDNRKIANKVVELLKTEGAI